MWPKRYREWRLWRKTAFDIPFRNTESNRMCARAWPEAIPIARPASRSEKIAPIRPAARFAKVQARGKSILIDPVWSERASPVSFAGPKRVNPPGIDFDHLPAIDAVLVTHNHYDHMDVDTIGGLWQRFRPRIVTPLGNDAILKKSVPGLVATAVDWGDAVDLGDDLEVHVEPTLHWSARGAGDRMYALWASFVVRAGAHKVYCVGDSGFGDGATFARVGKRHPRLALALLPIGAYEPRWFMRHIHMNPEDALEALRLSGAGRAFGHHWGTFRLTNEGVEQPVQDLA